jgi:hypothetical protein
VSATNTLHKGTSGARAPDILYSHSIILRHGNALIRQRKIFCAWSKTESPIRQKSPLLDSQENLVDSGIGWFRRLSVSIGRFMNPLAEAGVASLEEEKTVSQNEQSIHHEHLPDRASASSAAETTAACLAMTMSSSIACTSASGSAQQSRTTTNR